MDKPDLDYITFLLRLWRTEQHGLWKASLEDSQTGQRLGFGSISAVCTFLEEQIDGNTNNHQINTIVKGEDDE